MGRTLSISSHYVCYPQSKYPLCTDSPSLTTRFLFLWKASAFSPERFASDIIHRSKDAENNGVSEARRMFWAQQSSRVSLEDLVFGIKGSKKLRLGRRKPWKKVSFWRRTCVFHACMQSGWCCQDFLAASHKTKVTCEKRSTSYEPWI